MADQPERPNYSRPGYLVFSPCLLLPSFGIRLTRSDARAMALPPPAWGVDEEMRGVNQMWGVAEIAAPRSGDAFSVSYYYTANDFVADQDFMPLDEGHLRRLLLEIFSREEYTDILDHFNYSQNRWFEVAERGSSEPGEGEPAPQVRITDLRLAKDLKPAVFKRELSELKSALVNLETPVMKNGVLRWKWETLSHYKTLPKDPRGLDEAEAAKESSRVMAVSFAAAALLLLVDLDARKLREEGVDELAQRVKDLYDVIRKFSKNLDECTKELSTHVIGNPANRPPDPEAKHYTALVLYRMGHPLYKVALRVGITPRLPKKLRGRSSTPSGFQNWKGKVRKFIQQGAEVEAQRFPQAAEVFRRSHDEAVQKKAIEAYHDYADSWGQHLTFMELQDLDEGDELLGGVPANEEEQVNNAYLQLGSCLINEIDPFKPV
jgi:hypothetical protein